MLASWSLGRPLGGSGHAQESFLESGFGEVPYRQENAKGQDDDQSTQEKDQNRLDLASEGFKFVFDLALVEFCDVIEHGVEIAGLFADKYHLEGEASESAGLLA